LDPDTKLNLSIPQHLHNQLSTVNFNNASEDFLGQVFGKGVEFSMKKEEGGSMMAYLTINNTTNSGIPLTMQESGKNGLTNPYHARYWQKKSY
jgi:hypothetical protein